MNIHNIKEKKDCISFGERGRIIIHIDKNKTRTPSLGQLCIISRTYCSFKLYWRFFNVHQSIKNNAKYSFNVKCCFHPVILEFHYHATLTSLLKRCNRIIFPKIHLHLHQDRKLCEATEKVKMFQNQLLHHAVHCFCHINSLFAGIREALTSHRFGLIMPGGKSAMQMDTKISKKKQSTFVY